MPDDSFLPNDRGWIDEKRGVVSREVFFSDQIYRQEMERIFDRTWVFLAHESEIPNPGDYVTRTLGTAPVVVIRDNDGAIHGLLNSCRHRGPKVCRADAGNTKHFVCPYHGWTYERSGKLATVVFERHFPKDTNYSELSLVRIPKFESYKGLIFGSWNENDVPLQEFLGDFRWYLDCFFARTPQGMEVVAPPHRWRVKGNWKLGALNFIGDSMHVLTAHVGPTTLDPMRKAAAGLFSPGKRSTQIMTKEGHGCTYTYLREGLPEDTYVSYPAELEALYEKTLSPAQRETLRDLRVNVGNVFPNFSYIESPTIRGEHCIIIRQWHPTSGTDMEILSWVLIEREASPEYKARAQKWGPRTFGISGVFEQDDVEIWDAMVAASNNPIAQRYPYGFQTALPYLEAGPLTDYPGPGRAYRPVDCEILQFEFMKHWDRVMKDNA